MPYEGEFAHYRSIHRIVESERVQALLGNYRVRAYAQEAAAQLNFVSVEPGDWMPSLVLAIDGSFAPIPIRNGFPGAEAAYVTVASVLLDMAKMQELDRHRPVDPQAFQRLEHTGSVDCALPGCNVVAEGEMSAKSSLRKTLFALLGSERMATESETLLDTYEALLAYKPDTREQRCPYEDCPIEGVYQPRRGISACACGHARPLYSSDALRIHERMQPAGNNGEIYSEVMQVLEHLWMIHILRYLERKQWLSTLSRLAIVLDGPLAIFGQPAWLSEAIYRELSRLNNVAKKLTGGLDLLLLGVEKTGTFVEHLGALDRNEQGIAGVFPRQQPLLLGEDYIKQNIVFSTSRKVYGLGTYYGRKFFYKTRSGALIVATLPFLAEDHRDTDRAEASQYPRLADAMGVLDLLVSSRYPNSLAPIVSAHAEAAIPLNLGTRVLERLAKELIRES
jgi:NurA domain